LLMYVDVLISQYFFQPCKEFVKSSIFINPLSASRPEKEIVISSFNIFESVISISP
jgi:hypothetical protein